MGGNEKVKVICLGDSAVGKSKLVERYLKDNYKPQQLSTYALTLFKHTDTVDDREVRSYFSYVMIKNSLQIYDHR
jgi:Rab-like protein 2